MTARVCLQFCPSPMAATQAKQSTQHSLRRGAPRPNVRTAWSDVALHLVMLRQGERRGVKVRRRHWRDTCEALKPLDWECDINRFRSGVPMPHLFLEIFACGWCVRHTVLGVEQHCAFRRVRSMLRPQIRKRLSSGGRIDEGAM